MHAMKFFLKKNSTSACHEGIQQMELRWGGVSKIPGVRNIFLLPCESKQVFPVPVIPVV